ncbi:MAG: molybdate ABC transporter substrate-binding protein, partial [Chloroflexota bacterium]
VVILPPGNPAGLENLSDLAGEGIRLVLAAREAPVGNYSVQALDRLDKTFGSGFKGRVLANVVSYENDVKQVVVKVQLGEADAGIVYASDAAAAPELPSIEIPAEANVVAAYPLAALDQAQSPALARDFIAYVLSAEGQSILQKWGFLPVK